MVLISIKAFRRIRLYQDQLKRVNERLPGTEFSNYTAIEETNEDVNDSGYKELSHNVTEQRAKRNKKGTNQSEDKMDYQGYLVPEQHYHTIPEVEVHYAAGNVDERTLHQERFDSDDYLEPVI
ncbi:Hypothetical predicted protein [Mytilus galloprovincialis]|uniref:Uncharacterized protein n=1 Tax=Mytilus galloprovincialis TaxID=29158 RepID=A0A8B6E475_MYTGA|nr:Hypothetical predicted protein [Mytilus galloprovincialis]